MSLDRRGFLRVLGLGAIAAPAAKVLAALPEIATPLAVTKVASVVPISRTAASAADGFVVPQWLVNDFLSIQTPRTWPS